MTMPLNDQYRYLLVICKRCMPDWLRRHCDPEDIAQEAWITAWKASKDTTVGNGLLCCIAQRAIVNSMRHFNRVSRQTHQTIEEDIPFPTTEAEPDFLGMAQLILGHQKVDTLLAKTGRPRNMATHRAKKRINEYWLERGEWPL